MSVIPRHLTSSGNGSNGLDRSAVMAPIAVGPKNTKGLNDEQKMQARELGIDVDNLAPDRVAAAISTVITSRNTIQQLEGFDEESLDRDTQLALQAARENLNSLVVGG